MVHSSSGNATLKTPVGGFNDSRLSVIFSHTLPRPRGEQPSSTTPIASASPTSGTYTTGSPTLNPPQASHKATVGAIAGGTIGALLTLITVIFGCRFCYRRRGKGKVIDLPTETPAATSPAPWIKAELDTETRYELSGRHVEPPELPEGTISRGELATNYHCSELHAPLAANQ